MDFQSKPVSVPVCGIAGEPLNSARVRATISINIPGFSQPLNLEASGLTNIDIITPAQSLPVTITNLVADLKLADPDFGIKNKIDLILGADVYSHIIIPETLRRKRLVAQKTVFGWTIVGYVHDNTCNQPKLTTAYTNAQLTNHTCGHEELIASVKRFWAIEDVPKTFRTSEADVECEQHFL